MAGRKSKYNEEETPKKAEDWARQGLTDEQIDNLLNQNQKYFFNGKETDFESYIIENINEIIERLGLPEIRYIQRQKKIKLTGFQIRMDIIIQHCDESISIFEIKKTNKKYPSTAPTEQCKAIGQMLLYKNVIEEFYKQYTRIFLVDTKIYKRTLCVFANNDLPISLMEIQNDRVFLPKLKL